MPKPRMVFSNDPYDPIEEASAEVRRFWESVVPSDGLTHHVQVNEESCVVTFEDDASHFVYTVRRVPEPSPDLDDVYSLDALERLDLGSMSSVVEGLMHEGETVVLGGRPKVGKSRIVHQLALSLVDGRPFLGMAVPVARRVLLIDLENGGYGLRSRLLTMSADTVAKNCLFITFSDTLADRKLTNC